MRGTREIGQAQREVEDAVGRGEDQLARIATLGFQVEDAKRYAERTAGQAMSSLSTHLASEPLRRQRAIRRHLQAAWLGGAIIGSHLEGEPDAAVSISYDQMGRASQVINGRRPVKQISGVLERLELNPEATQDAASRIGMSLLPVLLSEAGVMHGTEAELATALATAWLDGLVVTVQARRAND